MEPKAIFDTITAHMGPGKLKPLTLNLRSGGVVIGVVIGINVENNKWTVSILNEQTEKIFPVPLDNITSIYVKQP